MPSYKNKNKCCIKNHSIEMLSQRTVIAEKCGQTLHKRRLTSVRQSHPVNTNKPKMLLKPHFYTQQMRSILIKPDDVSLIC